MDPFRTAVGSFEASMMVVLRSSYRCNSGAHSACGGLLESGGVCLCACHTKPVSIWWFFLMPFVVGFYLGIARWLR